jgi:hypothetical protein
LVIYYQFLRLATCISFSRENILIWLCRDPAIIRKKRNYLDRRGISPPPCSTPKYDISGQGSTVTFLKIPEI